MLLIPIVLLLTACAGIPSTREPILYNHAVELSVMTTSLQQMCGTPSTQLMVETVRLKSNIIAKYTTHVTKDVNEVATLISKEYQQLSVAYAKDVTPSKAYCTTKIALITQSVDLMIEMLGNKPHE